MAQSNEERVGKSLDRQKQDLLRVRFEEQARPETKRAATASIEGQPTGGLEP
jgi:hypothetical protein